MRTYYIQYGFAYMKLCNDLCSLIHIWNFLNNYLYIDLYVNLCSSFMCLCFRSNLPKCVRECGDQIRWSVSYLTRDVRDNVSNRPGMLHLVILWLTLLSLNGASLMSHYQSEMAEWSRRSTSNGSMANKMSGIGSRTKLVGREDRLEWRWKRKGRSNQISEGKDIN